MIGPSNRYAKVDGWLRSRALAGLREIEFGYEMEDPTLSYPLPPSAFRFAPTFRVASVGDCYFPTEAAPSLNFPSIKQLTLCWVTLSEDALQSLLSGCLVLESLLTLRSIGFAPFSAY